MKDYNVTFNFKIYRHAADKTQKEIAEVLGITAQQYYLYEAGARMMPLQMAVKLADYYGVKVDSFVWKRSAAYYVSRVDGRPKKRPVKVVWHTGSAGSGKSYSRMELIEKHGQHEVFDLNICYGNHMFDGYSGQKILWIDDFKGEIYPARLLSWLDGSKVSLPVRGVDRISAWEEVHIVSKRHPIQIFSKMCSRDITYKLMKCIDTVRYHYRLGDVMSRDPANYGFADFSADVPPEETEGFVRGIMFRKISKKTKNL